MPPPNPPPLILWIRGLSETNQRQPPVSPSVVSHDINAWSGRVKNGLDVFVLLSANMLKVAAWYLTVKQNQNGHEHIVQGSANLLTRPALVPYAHKLLFQLTKQHLRSHVSNNGRSVRPQAFLFNFIISEAGRSHGQTEQVRDCHQRKGWTVRAFHSTNIKIGIYWGGFMSIKNVSKLFLRAIFNITSVKQVQGRRAT